MQKERQWNLAQMGGLLLVAGIGAKVLFWVGKSLIPVANIAVAVGLVLLILGLVLPRKR